MDPKIFTLSTPIFKTSQAIPMIHLPSGRTSSGSNVIIFNTNQAPQLDVFRNQINNMRGPVAPVGPIPNGSNPVPNASNQTSVEDAGFAYLKSTLSIDFWKFVEGLRWTDRSDGVIDMNAKRKWLTTNYSGTHINIIKEHLKNHIKELKERFGENKLRHNEELLSHIVMKGKQYFDGVIMSPEFVAYLVDGNEYQDARALFEFPEKK